MCVCGWKLGVTATSVDHSRLLHTTLRKDVRAEPLDEFLDLAADLGVCSRWIVSKGGR
jgi:hypothetical protein